MPFCSDLSFLFEVHGAVGHGGLKKKKEKKNKRHESVMIVQTLDVKKNYIYNTNFMLKKTLNKKTRSYTVNN